MRCRMHQVSERRHDDLLDILHVEGRALTGAIGALNPDDVG
jgi:hypothetical protein